MSTNVESEETYKSTAYRLRRMRAISERCASLLSEAGPPIDHGDLLYEEWGLPKQSEANRKPNLDETGPSDQLKQGPRT